MDDVVVVEGAHALEAPAARLVRCEGWERGPGVSLRAGLAALGPEVTRAVVVLADGPELDPRAVDRLAAHPAAVAAASYDGTRDHPVALDRSVWDDVPDAGGRALDAELVDCSDLRAPGDRDVAGPRLALVIVESGPGIVLTHPAGGTAEAPASLPSGLLLPGETTEEGAVRLVREQTGLDVVVTERLIEFEQEGTPFGTAAMTGLVARVEGGELREGEEGPPVVYPLDGLPAIIPVRVANRRVLDAYLARRLS